MAVDLPNLPQDLLIALLQLVQALHRLQIRYALIGGVATGYRSRPRFTQDLDFLLDVPQLLLPGLLEDLPALGEPPGSWLISRSEVGASEDTRASATAWSSPVPSATRRRTTARAASASPCKSSPIGQA